MAVDTHKVNEILKQYFAGDLTEDQANAALAETGTGLRVTDNKAEGCNGMVEVGVGSPEPCYIENGKIVRPTGFGPQYCVYYAGKVWHTTSYEDPTLIAGYPDWIEEKNKEDK